MFTLLGLQRFDHLKYNSQSAMQNVLAENEILGAILWTKGTSVPTLAPTPAPTLEPTHRERTNSGKRVKDLDDDRDDDVQKMKQEFNSKGKVRYDAPVQTVEIKRTSHPTTYPTGLPTVAPTSKFYKEYIPGLDSPRKDSKPSSSLTSSPAPGVLLPRAVPTPPPVQARAPTKRPTFGKHLDDDGEQGFAKDGGEH